MTKERLDQIARKLDQIALNIEHEHAILNAIQGDITLPDGTPLLTLDALLKADDQP